MSGGGGGNDSEDWRPSSTIATSIKNGKGGGGGGSSGANPCSFTEVTNLSSPNSGVVSSLVVGSVLALTLQQSPRRVVAMIGGQVAGSITSARLADFIECMSSGQNYEAKVIHISGGAVTIEIYPV